MKNEKKFRDSKKESPKNSNSEVFDKKNMILFAIATIFIIIGYIVMGTGDKTISPIILVISYAVLFPIAILVGTFRQKDKK